MAKNLKKFVLAAVLCGSALVFTSGCGDYTGKEKSHPLFVKAGSSRLAGNYAEAAQYFEEFLYVCPKSPLAHYEIASLYAEQLDEPLKAIYHYGKYLELSQETLDSEDVQKIIEGQQKTLFEKLSKNFKSEETEKAKQEAERIRQLLDKYVKYSTLLKNQNDTMRQMIKSGKIVKPAAVNLDTVDLNAIPAGNTPAASAAAPAAGTVQTAPAADTATAAAIPPQNEPQTVNEPAVKRRTYKVKQGDTLSRIAREVYGKSSDYKLILEANKDTVGPKGNLKIGQVLVIPEKEKHE